MLKKIWIYSLVTLAKRGAIVLVASVGVVTPSYALSLNIGDFFGSIIEEAKTSIKKIEEKAKTQIDEAWAGIKEDAQAAIDSATGEMGGVDPIASSEILQERLKEGRSLPEARELGDILQRELTKSAVAAVLSKEGQSDTANNLAKNMQIAQEAKTMGVDAQLMDASQNILKAIAAQNALIVAALTQQNALATTTRMDTAQGNLMLSQIADNIAANRSRDNLRTMGVASLTQELIALSSLDPAYIKR